MVARMSGANHPAVRQNNRATIFRAIYESAPITRVDLAARTGLSGKTVSLIMDELIEHGLARELGYRASSGAGRKAVELEVDPSSRYAIGIDVAPPIVTAGLVDLSGQIQHQVVDTPMQPAWDIANTIQTAAHAAEGLVATLEQETRDKIVGVGIGAPGRFKIEDDRCFGLHGTGSGEWIDLGSVTDIDRLFGFPVTVDNNANTTALAEQWFGAGKGVYDFVLLNVSRGIGMGIVIGGDIYRGGNQNAGEAGHITVDVNGPRCICGNTGCLGIYVSTRAILSNVNARLASSEPSSLGDLADVSFDDVMGAFKSGDPVAAAVVADTIRYLAPALVSVINSYDPTMILIGRQLATAGEQFFTLLRAEVHGRLNPAIREKIRIEAADVSEAPVIGAGTLTLREFIRAPLEQPWPGRT